MSFSAFDEAVFKNRVNNALVQVKRILDNARHPQLPADVPHQYDDKYLLAESLVNTASAALLAALATVVNLSDKHVATMREWAKTRSVTLRLSADEKCKFLRQATREVQSDTTSVHTNTVFGTTKSFTVTKVTEWFWQFDAKYELSAFPGNDPAAAVSLAARAGTVELKTSVENTPRPVAVVRPAIDVNISWLLTHTNEKGVGTFKIDRSDKTCHTPRRNADVDEALRFMQSLFAFASSLNSYFLRELFPVDPGASSALPLNEIAKEESLFVPVVPLFEAKDGSPVLPADFATQFLTEQRRALAARLASLAQMIPPAPRLVSDAEARLCTLFMHIKSITVALSDGVDYIESMLFKQLVAAIGKEVSVVDFTNYQRYHNRKLFRREFQPRPFCYAIRRPDHYPEGLLSIENQLADGTIADPIYTSVCHSVAGGAMKFPINASTNVAFYGDRYLHGFVMHQFSGASGSSLSLRARARQFSSFIVLVGAIASADTFEPKYAAIIKDKDDLKIPLNLETIPTPKEFRDAIESLSPEQQRFAKAYRSMQLESTLFGVCVIQIKPQMEKLLNLDDDSLTKEIELTQDIMNLFIEYQIPSDLISYDGEKNAEAEAKVARVKQLVAAMKQLIARSKAKELEEARRKQELERARNEAELRRLAEEQRLKTLVNEQAVYMSMSLDMAAGPPVQMSAPPSGGRGGGGGGMMRMMSPPSPLPPSAPMAAPYIPMPAPAPSPIVVAAPVKPAEPVRAAEPAPPKAEPVKAPEPAKAAEPAKVVEAPKEKQALVPATGGNAVVTDFTKIPALLERKFDELDEDGALRPTIISAGNTWQKSFQKALLAAPESATLGKDQQGQERTKAFDLLDALTRSGVVSVDAAELHVVIASTHCFAKSVMQTVVQDNVNPIEKVERSALIVASTIQQRPAVELVADDQVARLALYSPKLIQQ